MIKRNCKKILLLIMTLLVGNHNIEAMGRFGKFAKEVFRSKTVIGAGTLACLNMTTYAYLFQKINSDSSSLSESIQKEIQDKFSRLGIDNIKVLDFEYEQVPIGVQSCFEHAVVGFSPHMRALIKSNSITEDELYAIFQHEAAHVKNQDTMKKSIVLSVISPAALMLAKAIRVAGGSKKLVVGSGLISFSGISLAQKWYSRNFVEQRCDDAVTPEYAEHLASALKKICPTTTKDEFIAQYDEYARSSGHPSYKELRESEKKKLNKYINFLDGLTRLASDHLPVNERIARLEERYDPKNLK